MRLSTRHIFWLKAALHLCGILPLLWWIAAINNDWFSADPIKDSQHFTGLMALKFLLATLAVSPLAKFTHQPALMRCRRLLGLWCFAWATFHLLCYAFLELGFDFSLLGSELLKRPYLNVGIVAWVLLLALAFTSFKSAQRKMGANWQRLHNLIYVIAILVPIHYIWSVKILSPQPIIYTLIASILLLLRYKKLTKFKKRLKSEKHLYD